MSEAAKWYIIHTYSGYENKVKQDIEKVVENRKLHDLILEVQVPTETVTEITDGKTKELERKTFPGYVFLKMVYTDDTWHVVKNIRGVTPVLSVLVLSRLPFPKAKWRKWAWIWDPASKSTMPWAIPSPSPEPQWTDSPAWYRPSIWRTALWMS